MRILIDIPKEEYDEILSSEDCGLHTLTRAVANGTPVPTDAVDRVTIKEYLESFGNVKTEQEPCEDCISRSAVEDTIINYRWKYSALYESIKQLPSVTPQPKMGRWIEHFDESGKWYECDQCHTDWGGSVNYCPNCGAKMQEVEE